MEIQSSLFESAQQGEGFVPSRKKIGPRTVVLKSMEILPINVPEIQHKEEVDRLMQATINRMFIPRSEYLEYIEVSKLLITASEKFRMTISNVVDRALELMRKLPNLYVNQAIFMSLEEPIYGFAIKKSIANTFVRRPICRK